MSEQPCNEAAAVERPMVEAEQLHKWFGAAHVLKGIDLEVKRREVMCVVGPSGSGKSTLLRCVNHLEKIDSGRLSVDGELVGYRERAGKLYELREREVARQRRDIGMVFQRFNLFPHMTALENVVEAPTQVKGLRKEQARQRGVELLERVGLGGSPYPSAGPAESLNPVRVAPFPPLCPCPVHCTKEPFR